ncbi:putative cytochrome P450 oxidoreductase [Cryphonectria parasitica EP155]|uniref:Cytochrome P450 oxidoreductase n=1 Tax=Cryphonectria parasitica (strain ATCC 38755 / EP155) TaxID=660469 RepID=A0A9P4Y8M2_CRYP1|nr:putative cytochrome P450 oxidoreductase [Cryphonectria parasitica EP155]KAF3768808.1 putative cytochrome P450 oxidoreductase [Cryphonectria parasitica EP155]
MTWGKEYNSDVIHIKVLGQHMICLNSNKAAVDLLDRRGSNYSDRPRFTLFEVMGWGLTLTFLRWGPRFKLHRRLFQTTLTRSSIKTFQPIQMHEAHKAVRSLLKTPNDWRDVTLLLTTSIIFRIAYGQEIKSKASPYTGMSRAANDVTTNGGIAGSSVVDIFPLARYFLPSSLSPALRHARQSRETIKTIHEVPWDNNMRDIKAGTATPSFMKTHFDRWVSNAKAGIHQEATIEDLKGATAAVFIAGGNSTWGTVLSAILFLTKFPDVQRRVQEEIDTVVGTGRLPTFQDRPTLKYLDAFLTECMRVLPLNPLVIPHCSLKDDVYEGMFIPAGSVVFANAKAMTRDPNTYQDPEKFDPDRYAKGEPSPPGNFGFGRRKCPGNHLALATVYIYVATMMSVFEIEKVVDRTGRAMEPEIELTVGLGGHPAPFECQLKLRSPERAWLLQDEEMQEYY